MTAGGDDFDPADWLASQFGEEEKPRPRDKQGEKDEGAKPADSPPVAPQPPAAQPPAVQPPVVPPTVYPPVTAPPSSAPPPSSGGGFTWGLTPGGTPDPAPPAEPRPVAPPELIPPADPFPPALPPVEQPAVEQPSATPDWDTPTVASPVIPGAGFPPADPPATVAYPDSQVARQEFPGFSAPLDPALEGATELFDAQAVGLPVPQNEGPEGSSIDDLFGESAFRDYADEPIIARSPRPSSAVAVIDRAPRTQAEPIPRVQKILMSVAGGLVAALALVALFLVGTRIAQNAPAPAVLPTPSATASSTPGPLAIGPVAPGEYQWDDLLGGECLSPFESAWQDRYTVVPCTQEHQGQLVARGEFADDSTVAYPGVEELQTRMTLICSAPTVIDYAAAAGASDIQIAASFPADDADWLDGNRTYYCFASRTGGATLATSIAVPQVAPTPTPAP